MYVSLSIFFLPRILKSDVNILTNHIRYCISALFIIILNSLIHVIMYAYYGLSACGESIQKYLWWKRYITQAQMVRVILLIEGFSENHIRMIFRHLQLQFVAVIIHSSINLQVQCNFPKVFDVAFLAYGVTILMFFVNFYVQSYINSKNRKKKN